MKRRILLNVDDAGVAACIKSNYYKSSGGNLLNSKRGGQKYCAVGVIEYEPVQVDDSASDGQGLCDVPAEVGVRPELS